MARRMIAFVAAVVLLGAGSAFALPYSSLYVIGDSLSDPGNLLALTTQANQQNPAIPIIPPPPYDRGHFSNGPTASEHLAQNLGLTPDKVRNYSFGGATTGVGNVLDGGDQNTPGVLGLPGVALELQQFKADIAARGGVADPKALYMMWAGPNDVFAGLIAGVTNFEPIVNAAVNNIVRGLTDMLSAGAKTILVPNTPNLGLTPRFRQGGPAGEQVGTLISLGFNAGLEQGLQGLEQAFPMAEIIRFDILGSLAALTADPAAFGLPGLNVRDQCLTGNPLQGGAACSDPNGFLFWDEVHPTSVVHALLGDLLTAAVVPIPGTLLLFALGIALFAMQRKLLRRG
jgi:cholinesterase